ncbi:hypothetical protein MPTK1_3g24930 [Marchantia polymorpha subsp. ruderalis]
MGAPWGAGRPHCSRAAAAREQAVAPLYGQKEARICELTISNGGGGTRGVRKRDRDFMPLSNERDGMRWAREDCK